MVSPSQNVISLSICYLPLKMLSPSQYFISLSICYLPLNMVSPSQYVISLSKCYLPLNMLSPSQYVISLSSCYLPLKMLSPSQNFISLSICYLPLKILSPIGFLLYFIIPPPVKYLFLSHLIKYLHNPAQSKSCKIRAGTTRTVQCTYMHCPVRLSSLELTHHVLCNKCSLARLQWCTAI